MPSIAKTARTILIIIVFMRKAVISFIIVLHQKTMQIWFRKWSIEIWWSEFYTTQRNSYNCSCIFTNTRAVKFSPTIPIDTIGIVGYNRKHRKEKEAKTWKCYMKKQRDVCATHECRTLKQNQKWRDATVVVALFWCKTFAVLQIRFERQYAGAWDSLISYESQGQKSCVV